MANHSSMIDFIILMQSHPYAVVGQKHPGWVGMLQDSLLGALRPIWFDRTHIEDRKIVAERLRAHAHDASKAHCPILIFPEGTCVNNEYVVQFKKGPFELGVQVNPIAIKYNRVRRGDKGGREREREREREEECLPSSHCALHALIACLCLLPAHCFSLPPCRSSWRATGTAGSRALPNT